MAQLTDNPYSLHTHDLLQAIVEAQACFIKGGNISQSFPGVLKSLLTLTHSHAGCIGEVSQSSEGEAYLHGYSVIEEDLNAKELEGQAWLEPNLHVSNLNGAIGQLIISGNPIIDNTPNGRASWGKLFPCPYSVQTFLGVPIHNGNSMVGLLGLANRSDGYDDALVDFLQPLLSCCGMLIEASRNGVARNQEDKINRETEIKFRSMADTAPVLIWISDSQKNCTYVNQGWLDFTGRNLEQELGNGWIDNIHPEDRKECLAICEAAFQSRTSFEMEIRLKHRRTKEYRWVIDRGVPRFDLDGTFIGFIGTCADITEQKLHEQAIARYNQLLQKEIEGRTVRIQELEQRRMQVEKLAALSQVTAGIAHEINNPLASIQQSLLLVKSIVPHEHSRAKYVPKIEQEIQRIATIIKQMYQLYQPRQEYPRLMNLNQVVKDACELIVNLHKNSHGQLHLDLCNDMYDLPLPQTELRQVICNVLQNAFDAVEENGLVQVRTGVNTGSAWIQIHDDGPGIPPDILSHIFEPFYSTKVNQKRSGMGLGLSVSKSLLEAMGGQLQVASTVGHGATFTISFPLPLVPAYSSTPEEHTTGVLTSIS